MQLVPAPRPRSEGQNSEAPEHCSSKSQEPEAARQTLAVAFVTSWQSPVQQASVLLQTAPALNLQVRALQHGLEVVEQKVALLVAGMALANAGPGAEHVVAVERDGAHRAIVQAE